ncbi:hypothetical protein CDL15_Pgr022131 [Punica granatum]|uniref:Uncharacterized protein n=1 Tax=Punica granatum TaxID=22663 RepID=A0A218VSP7_PUNGR|nr:hypothetical protein CDL15_Pgr022131 [Punica granatum]
MVQRQAWLVVRHTIGCMLDDLCRMLGGDGLITVFTGDAVACECCRKEVVLWVGLTLKTKSILSWRRVGTTRGSPVEMGTTFH